MISLGGPTGKTKLKKQKIGSVISRRNGNLIVDARTLSLLPRGEEDVGPLP
jgi:hypothetical protein